MNDKPRLVIVSGPPASGKSTIARLLGDELVFPVICKDQLKELMADNLGVKDFAWSRLLGSVSFEMLYVLTETFLRANVSLILEANFRYNPHRNPFEEMLQMSRAVVLECTADSDVLMNRYRERYQAGDRHQIHFDIDHLDSGDLKIDWASWPRLGLECPSITVDTTDPTTVDLQRIARQIKC